MAILRPGLEKFVGEVRAKQKNILWPDTLRNSRSAYLFLWRGSPNPAPVQRVGAWLFGLTFMGAGLMSIREARLDGSVLSMAFAWAWLVLGANTFRNGFRRRGPG